MKILYISNEYPPETGFGGIGTYTRCIAEGMADRGHVVHVIARSIFDRHETLKQKGVTIHRIPPDSYPLPKSKYLYLFRKICYNHIPHTLIRLSWASAVRNEYLHLIQDINFDIVEYPECGAEGYYLNAHSKQVARLHTPWHLIHHLDNLDEGAIDLAFLDKIEKRSIVNAHIVTSPSQALADHIRKKWNIKNIFVIPNPLPSNQYEHATGPGWIYTGRLEMRKGVHILIKAYAALPPLLAPNLTLIGKAYGKMPDGTTYESYIQNLIGQYNLGQKVTLIPGVPHYEIKKYLQKSSVAFFPSLWENFPYACLEAMACGLTVVASDTGGYTEMIENHISGLLVKANSTDALQHAMMILLEKPELAKELGQNARTRVRNNFDNEIICKQMEKIYEGTPVIEKGAYHSQINAF